MVLSWLPFWQCLRVSCWIFSLSCAFMQYTLAIKQHVATPAFRKFCCQLFYQSLSKILVQLKPHMIKWKLKHFPNGYFHQVIFTLGLYIADYEEQVLLSCIVWNWCLKYVAMPATYSPSLTTWTDVWWGTKTLTQTWSTIAKTMQTYLPKILTWVSCGMNMVLSVTSL